jgi:hypothetical protein
LLPPAAPRDASTICRMASCKGNAQQSPFNATCERGNLKKKKQTTYNLEVLRGLEQFATAPRVVRASSQGL